MIAILVDTFLLFNRIIRGIANGTKISLAVGTQTAVTPKPSSCKAILPAKAQWMCQGQMQNSKNRKNSGTSPIPL
jgi:hypothetical protein